MAAREKYTHYPRPILWLVPGGQITVGGPEPDAEPRFRVEVEAFYLAKWPVTNEQFEAFDPAFEPSPCSPGERDTAVGITWEQAHEYCRWYAAVARKPMRLPTEIEWEYACRAGNEARYFWGEEARDAEDYVWDARNSEGRVRPPEEKRGNGFGLHGMLGGVWEWTASPYLRYPLATPGKAEDEGAAGDASRVLRGGSFRLDREALSCSLRRPAHPELIAEDVGFRVARSFR